MFSSKDLSTSPNTSNSRLSPSTRPFRRRLFHQSPSPSRVSMASGSTNLSENVSALKAKYTDYAMWLKASSRQNREPVFTHELLKHSLCEMGIESNQAEQLVSTCTWYVYQFQKELEHSPGHIDQPTGTEQKALPATTGKRHKTKRSTKKTKSQPPRDRSADSIGTISSMNKENMIIPGPPPPTRSRFPVLPPIQNSEPMTSPRSRHVDFDNEQSTIQSSDKGKSSRWHSLAVKTRLLPKLRSGKTVLSINDHDDNESILIEPPSANSIQTRSILRKQLSSTSSIISIDPHPRKNLKTLTPPSTIIDDVPLGTKSQRLFGGSECFAEIMNELEEQNF